MESKVLPGKNIEKMLERYGRLWKPDFASDISRELDGYDELILIGHSMGVLAAYQLLKRLRDSGDKRNVYFVACEPLTAPRDTALLQRVLLKAVSLVPTGVAARSVARPWPGELLPTTKIKGPRPALNGSALDEWERHIRLTKAFPPGRMLAESRYIARQLPLEPVVFTDVPTVVIWSENDTLLRRKVVDRTLRELLGANLLRTLHVRGEHGHVLENQADWYRKLHQAFCALGIEPLR